MNRQPDDVDRVQVDSPLAMSRVVEASGQEAGPVAALEVPPAPPAQADPAAWAFANTHRARVLLEQQNVFGPTRFSLPKRFVLRMSRLFTYRLVAAGQALADAVEDSVRIQNQAHAEVVEGLVRIQNKAQAEVVEGLARIQNETHADVVEGLARVQNQAQADVVEGLARIQNQTKDELQRLRALVSRRALEPSSVADFGTAGTEVINEPVLDDSTYVKFEQRFRGTSQEIKQRQLDALPFLESIAGSKVPLLDLGCGRGEWLEVLRDAGIPAYGVDSNDGMVADALALGLDARCEDVLTHLEGLGESSLQAVSAFQFVEHVPLAVLTHILDAAFLALRPGGVLLLETPNPTNLVVGSANFYLDPTHLRPLHPLFLQFFVESRGFSAVEVHFVHPAIETSIMREGGPDNGYDPRLTRVVESAEWSLFGPQDYVVVAQRAGPIA